MCSERHSVNWAPIGTLSEKIGFLATGVLASHAIEFIRSRLMTANMKVVQWTT
jgi:hypothetical protein